LLSSRQKYADTQYWQAEITLSSERKRELLMKNPRRNWRSPYIHTANKAIKPADWSCEDIKSAENPDAFPFSLKPEPDGCAVAFHGDIFLIKRLSELSW
jgi:hypothetical protein